MPEPDRRTDEPHGSPSAAGGTAEGKLLRERLTALADGSGDEPGGAGSYDDGSIDFQQLAQGKREVLVRLAGQTYRLRWTRNDKLILTK